MLVGWHSRPLLHSPLSHMSQSVIDERTPLLSNDIDNIERQQSSPRPATPSCRRADPKLPMKPLVVLTILNAMQPLVFELVFPFISKLLSFSHIVTRWRHQIKCWLRLASLKIQSALASIQVSSNPVMPSWASSQVRSLSLTLSIYPDPATYSPAMRIPLRPLRPKTHNPTRHYRSGDIDILLWS